MSNRTSGPTTVATLNIPKSISDSDSSTEADETLELGELQRPEGRDGDNTDRENHETFEEATERSHDSTDLASAEGEDLSRSGQGRETAVEIESGTTREERTVSRIYSFEERAEENQSSHAPTFTMEHSGLIKCGLGVLAVAAILIVILVPLSFSDLEYYEMGFEKSRTTGKVMVDKVYIGGRHFLGVTSTFKKFRADAHMEVFDRISVFNKEKLSVTMTCGLQYFLYPKELSMLHDSYDIRYQPVLRQTVLSAIKSSAAQFTVEEYRLERPKIAEALAHAATVSLGGVCCRKDCVTKTNCSKSDRGLYAEMRYFQLELVDVTEEQDQKFLRQVIETERQDTEQFKQQEQITRKETERYRREIENEASEVTNNSTAKSSLIKARAEAEAKAIVEDARNAGLQIIYELLNVTKPEHKKSFDYIRTLRDSNAVNLYFGFTTIVAKP